MPMPSGLLVYRIIVARGNSWRQDEDEDVLATSVSDGQTKEGVLLILCPNRPNIVARYGAGVFTKIKRCSVALMMSAT